MFSENADDISCAHSVMIRKFIVFRFLFLENIMRSVLFREAINESI